MLGDPWHLIDKGLSALNIRPVSGGSAWIRQPWTRKVSAA